MANAWKWFTGTPSVSEGAVLDRVRRGSVRVSRPQLDRALMAKRTKMPTDLNQRAKAIVDLASGEIEPDEKDEARSAGGRKALHHTLKS